MTLFPFFVDIEEKNFLIVGGGRIAEEKVSKLVQFTSRLVVVAETVTEEIQRLAAEGFLQVKEKVFSPADLDNIDYCIAATDDRAVNEKVFSLCKERGILVNVVDTLDLCEFIFPSLVKRGDLTVAVSTAGKSPAMARYLRRKIEELLPEETESVIARLGSYREKLPERIFTQRERGAAYQEMLDLLLRTKNQATEQEIDEIIHRHSSSHHE